MRSSPTSARSLAATTPAWSAADVNLASTVAIGDLILVTITRPQLTAVSIAILDVWPPYPTVNLNRTTGGLTRLSLLQPYLDGEHEQILAFGARPPPPRIPPPPIAPPPPPSPPPTPALTPAASTTPPSRFSAPLTSRIAARPPAASAFPPFATYTSGAVRAVAQYYTPDCQYGGLDDDSLSGTRATFTSVCEAFSVPPPIRAVCRPFALCLTEHNLSSLFQHNRGLFKPNLWNVIHSRVYPTARTLRVREHRQSTTYCSEPAQPSDTAVSRFDHMIAHLSLLKSQLPPRYHTAAMLAEKILDTTRGEWLAVPLISGASHSNPHKLAPNAKLFLAIGPPGIRSLASLSAPLGPDAPAATAFLTTTPTAPPPFDTWTIDTTIPDDSALNEVFYVLRRFRGGADRAYSTEISPARPYRGFGPANPCRICRGTDHFAYTYSSLRPAKPAALAAALFASPTTTSFLLPGSPTPFPPPPIDILPQTDPVNCDNLWLLPVQPVSAVYSAPEADMSTAIADIDTPSDIVGDSWLRRHPQVATSPRNPATTRYALGDDVPPSIGRLSLRITTTDTSGRALSIDHPDVRILHHAAVHILLGLHSHQRLNMIVDAARNTSLFGRARRPGLCHVQRVHLTLPPPPTPPATPTFYTRSELSLAHRQFGRTSVDALLRAFPHTTFTPTDVATLRDVARSFVPC